MLIRKSRTYFLAVAVSLFFFAVAIYCMRGWYEHRKIDQNQLLGSVERGDLESVVSAIGTVEAGESVNVGAQASGQLVWLGVKLGDNVRKGQLIARIDAQAQRNALRQAKAQSTSFRAQLVAKEVALKQAALTLTRQRTLSGAGATSQELLEAAIAAVDTLHAERAGLVARLKEANVSEDLARENLRYTRIESPIDGVVVAVLARQGQTINGNFTVPTIVRVAQTGAMRLRAEVSELDVTRLVVGQAAYFTTLGEPERRREAVVTVIEPAPISAADESGAGALNGSFGARGGASAGPAIYYYTHLNIPRPDVQLRIGMTAHVRVVLARAQGVLIVPVLALGATDDQGRRAIIVVDASAHLQRRWVRLGLIERTRVQVTEGVREGERVVIARGLLPTDGNATSTRQ